LQHGSAGHYGGTRRVAGARRCSVPPRRPHARRSQRHPAHHPADTHPHHRLRPNQRLPGEFLTDRFLRFVKGVVAVFAHPVQVSASGGIEFTETVDPAVKGVVASDEVIPRVQTDQGCFDRGVDHDPAAGHDECR